MIYLVGGTLRDKLMGKKPKDVDYAFEGTYEQMRDYILNNGGKIFIEKPEFGTIRCLINSEACDYAVCRKDGNYSDGRRPDNITLGDIYEDLSRRDFTMNAIAQNIKTGEVLDPYDGKDAIKHGFIECVGNTRERFEEDALRMLRALRFSVTLNFQLSYDIRMFLTGNRHLHLLNNVSDERIYEELSKMFKHNTLKTLHVLDLYPELEEYLFLGDSLWLKPTMESK